MASKCPKSKHYSGSESMIYRVSAAVCQKNIGHTYVDHVYQILSLSPLGKGIRIRKIRQGKMERKRLFAGSKEGKKRRKELKSKRSSQASNVQRK